ncbi:hypothetical protein QBC43DRAFT_338303 [Cladorrhinum sp. PSN259]|nr:hypothetical protein QBC43DRAFT_338303 [Cladorrhinum sp. PSN259]
MSQIQPHHGYFTAQEQPVAYNGYSAPMHIVQGSSATPNHPSTHKSPPVDSGNDEILLDTTELPRKLLRTGKKAADYLRGVNVESTDMESWESVGHGPYKERCRAQDLSPWEKCLSKILIWWRSGIVRGFPNCARGNTMEATPTKLSLKNGLGRHFQ